LTIDVPHTSLPYNSTGFTMWVSKSLKSLNINSWYGSIESLMQYINIDVKKVKNMKIDLKSLIYGKLKQKYNFVQILINI
jgi:hypothetical protein